MLPKHSSQRNPALSGDTGLNLREKNNKMYSILQKPKLKTLEHK